MVTEDDLKKYELYLIAINKQLDKFFAEQKPYICCKEGCSYCCEKGEYPYSEIEFAYLMIGVRSLLPETVKEIENNIVEIKKLRENSTDKPFMYKCPFLIDKKCSLYNYRGIICRTHGLAFFNKEQKIRVPACVDRGLNYSKVYDFNAKTISKEKYLKLGIEQEPLAHNVGLFFMTNNSLTKELELDFGEIKPMFDWFE